MSDSLRDQLMKKGLVSEQEAKKARSETKRKKGSGRKPKGQRGAEQSEAARFAAQVDAAKRARDRDLNQAREAERQREANEKAARDMLVKHEVKRDNDCEIPYNFTFDGRIKKLNVNARQRDALAAGEMAIGRTRGRFRLVPRETAERIRELAPFLIVHIDDGSGDADDPDYEDFPVPDDLMW